MFQNCMNLFLESNAWSQKISGDNLISHFGSAVFNF